LDGRRSTERRSPRKRKGQRISTPPNIIAAVGELVLLASDDLIAGILNRNKIVTGNGNRWTRERVTSLRSHHRIPVYRPASDGVEPWLNLTKAAALLDISAKMLRLAAEAGEIDATHPFAEGPWIFNHRTAVKAQSPRMAKVMIAREVGRHRLRPRLSQRFVAAAPAPHHLFDHPHIPRTGRRFSA
jgi:hypothetical protein